MLKSKALKDFSDEKTGKLYDWWVESVLRDWYYDIQAFFRRPYLRIKKLYEWNKHVFAHDYDFDGHCLFAIIEYKLRRVLPELENGHAIQEDQEINALKLAIKLASRLKEDEYERIAWDRHEKIWGDLITWTTPYGNDGMSQWHFRFEKVNTDEEKERCNKDRNALRELAYKRMVREEKWLYAILAKYLRRWWD